MGVIKKTNLALICDLRIYVTLVSQCGQTIQVLYSLSVHNANTSDYVFKI